MYNETISDILVFKTNILHTDLEKVASILKNDPRIENWNIDCADVDKVLRLQSNQLTSDDVINLIIDAGFQCEELPD